MVCRYFCSPYSREVVFLRCSQSPEHPLQSRLLQKYTYTKILKEVNASPEQPSTSQKPAFTTRPQTTRSSIVLLTPKGLSQDKRVTAFFSTAFYHHCLNQFGLISRQVILENSLFRVQSGEAPATQRLCETTRQILGEEERLSFDLSLRCAATDQIDLYALDSHSRKVRIRRQSGSMDGTICSAFHPSQS